MSRFVVGFLAVLLSASAAHAQVTMMRYTVISGTASARVTGKCTQTGTYADQCISGNCSCVTVSGATVGAFPTCATAPVCPKLAGLGTADLFLTFDDGLVMPSASTGETPECTPFFGIANLNTKRAGGTIAEKETLNLTGVSCEPPSLGAKTVFGGFGVSSSPAPINGGTGFGKVRGLYIYPETGPISLTLHGPITQ